MNIKRAILVMAAALGIFVFAGCNNMQMTELNIDIEENRQDELLFSFSINDFISRYNYCYYADKGMDYLNDVSDWQIAVHDSAPHSPYKTNYYYFKEDYTTWTLPAITVYTPYDNEKVLEICVSFDDHSYSEDMYDLYEEMCYYTLRSVFGSMSEHKITELYETLNKSAYNNIFPHEKGYGNGAFPHELYYKDNIGVYPYFAVGQSVRLCIIPVNQRTIDVFKANGVKIHEIF